MTQSIAGNLTPTITPDLPGTFIFPALSPLVSKRSSQFITNRNKMRKVDFEEQVFDVQ